MKLRTIAFALLLPALLAVIPLPMLAAAPTTGKGTTARPSGGTSARRTRPASGGAAVHAKAMGLLRAAASRWSADRTYRVHGVYRQAAQLGAQSQSASATFELAGAPGGRSREEIYENGTESLTLSDGNYTSSFIGSFGQYTRHRGVTPALDSLGRMHRGDATPGVRSLALGPAAGALDGLESVRLLRADTVHTEAGVQHCDVLLASYAPAKGDTAKVKREVWVSRADSVIVRHGLRTERAMGDRTLIEERYVTFDRVQLGASLLDSLFAFTPPAGAREVLAFERPGSNRLDLTGQSAPGFELADVDGALHKLEEHRGSVVLLDFWATWCGPCRMTMPALDRLTREFKGRGLVVYSVNLRERGDVAANFMTQRGFSMTTLLDRDGAVASLYGATAIPSFVIVGTDGVIKAHLVGAHAEGTMRAALARAGLE
ncbi:MAG: TlpA family protein disulfide reductase [Candidatus Eisenbacteria bacterium]|uniref:TlpA family protein disulfide reductase n=1 Tax=Eiseniibacteriota bacterium TaxID=2212470 RepID=A0A849SEY6_UNCEI|nr:TlpA family protein disulfide reductase [Candidatus Eisenbacteria bacterium]